MFKIKFRSRLTVKERNMTGVEKKPPELWDDDDMTGLPEEFKKPEEFRKDMEKKDRPGSRLGVPALPVYLVLVSAMAWWVYYGWQYSKTHFPVSLTALLVFFGIFLVPFFTLVVFRDFNRRARMCPVLKRIAGRRPGAFLVVEGMSPTLFYARETWIGKVVFDEGSEDRNASTRLEARMEHPLGRLEIHKKGILGKVLWGSDKEIIRLTESEFSRKFVVSGTDAGFANTFLDGTVSGAIMRLAEFGNPWVYINRSLVRVEVRNDLSVPRKEDSLSQFLADAEFIIGKASQETLGAIPGSGQVPIAVGEGTKTGIVKKLLFFVALAMLVIAAGFSVGEWRFHRQFVQRAQEIKSLAGAPDQASITEEDLVRVPVPVQRYLRYVGVVGRKPIRYAHYRSTGSVKGPGKPDWRPFRGEYFFTTAKPSVCWFGRAKTLSVMHLAYYDCYFGGKGRMISKSMSVFPLRDASDDDLARSGFLKFISEMPVYPTAFLDRALVSWRKSDATWAEGTFKDSGLAVPAVFFFAPDGSIARVEIMRPMGRGKDAPPEKWAATYGGYKDFGGFQLPTRFEASWNLKTGDVPIAKFAAETIELE